MLKKQTINTRHLDIGMWLSLVEHSVRDAGVGSSNLLIPTTQMDEFRNSHT